MNRNELWTSPRISFAATAISFTISKRIVFVLNAEGDAYYPAPKTVPLYEYCLKLFQILWHYGGWYTHAAGSLLREINCFLATY